MTQTLALSYRTALALLLGDRRKSSLVRALRKGELPFRKMKEQAGFDHNQSLVRALRKLEDLGLVDHTYKHGSAEVYSFYGLTPFGKEVLSLLDSLEGPGRKSKS